MSEESRQILEMLSRGKVTVDEAERLLAALKGAPGSRRSGKPPRFLRVIAQDGEKRVNVSVPLALIRAGMKFTALIPEKARADVEKHLSAQGIDLDLKKLKPEDLEELVKHLADLQVDVEEGGEKKVRVFCE